MPYNKGILYLTLNFMVLFLIISATSWFFVYIPPAMAAGVLRNIIAIPTNNLVDLKTTYDIVFTTGTAGSIKTVDIAFPAGFDILSPSLIEKANIGTGLLSIGTDSLIYTVSNPVSISAGSTVRLEVGNIINPGTLGSFKLTLTTKDSDGNIIDGPTPSSPFSFKQIGANDISSNAITNSKIATGAVTPDKISGLSKIIYSNFCTIDWPPSFETTLHADCSVPGIAPGDSVLVTPVTPSAALNRCAGGIVAHLFLHALVSQDTVTIYIINGCQRSDVTPTRITYSILAFHP